MPNEPAGNSAPTSTEQSSSASPPSEHPTGTAESTGFRYSDEAPKDLRGLTAAEAAQRYSALQGNLDEVIQQVNAYLSSQQAPMSNAQYRQPVTAHNYGQPQQPQSNPELWYTDPAAAEAAFAARMNQQMQSYAAQVAQPLLQSSIDNAYFLAKNDPANKPLWDKYGKEIEALVNSPQIPPAYRANKVVWDQAAKLVASQHIDDIAQERAQQIAATMQGGVERTNPTSYTATPAETSAMDKLRDSAYGKHLIERYGERKVIENCQKAGWTLDQYATMVANTNVTRDPEKPGEWINTDLVRGE